ncbi:LysR substrate-binding domain-containing protein [Streptomyces viridiviolaceus]
MPGGCAGRCLRVVVVPDHPWARRRSSLRVDELAATPIVVRERGSGTRETLDHALRRAGAEDVRPLLELGSAAAARGVPDRGAGTLPCSASSLFASIRPLLTWM